MNLFDYCKQMANEKMQRDYEDLFRRLQQQAPFDPLHGLPKPSPAPSIESLLEPPLRKIADELGFAYIQPTISQEVIDLFKQNKLDAIKVRYIDMLRYFNITKDMMKI